MMGAWTDGLLAQQRRQAKLRSVANHLDSHNQKSSQKDINKKDVPNPFAQKKPDRWEQAVAVLEKRKQLFRQAGILLHDRSQTAIVLVMTADVLPLAETKRAIEQLEESKLTPAAIVINQLIVPTQSDEFWLLRAKRQQRLLQDIENSFSKYPLYPIYLQQTDIRGTEALSMLLRPPS